MTADEYMDMAMQIDRKGLKTHAFRVLRHELGEVSYTTVSEAMKNGRIEFFRGIGPRTLREICEWLARNEPAQLFDGPEPESMEDAIDWIHALRSSLEAERRAVAGLKTHLAQARAKASVSAPPKRSAEAEAERHLLAEMAADMRNARWETPEQGARILGRFITAYYPRARDLVAEIDAKRKGA